MAPMMTVATDVEIPIAGLPGESLAGTLIVPPHARGIVIFAHGAGSSRLSPRNTSVAEALRVRGRLGTLLFDLLLASEDVDYRARFDIDLLTERLEDATKWLAAQTVASHTLLGYFGASTGAAAALRAAARFGDSIAAVVSRGGRPDLAMEALPQVTAPTLLIVGGHDPSVIEMNRAAYEQLGSRKELRVVPGATHLFEEPGTLEQVAALALDWFETYLAPDVGYPE